MRVSLARSSYRHYFEDKRVRQWVQNVEDGSEVTAHFEHCLRAM